MININMNLTTAAAVRRALFQDIKDYTYDPTCTPPRVTEIRNVIVDIDTQIEEELKNEITNS